MIPRHTQKAFVRVRARVACVRMAVRVRVVYVRQASVEQAKTRGAARSRGVRFALGAFGLCVCARRAGLQFMRERDRTRCMSMYVTRCMLWSSFFFITGHVHQRLSTLYDVPLQQSSRTEASRETRRDNEATKR